MRIRFLSDEETLVGGIELPFTSTPMYKIWLCSIRTEFSKNLPPDTDKIWTLSLSKTTSVRLVIHCNDVEVLNVVLSDTICSDDATWTSYWTRDVGTIEFATLNTAADYYRPGKDYFRGRTENWM